ncbi:hypothetical protein [Amycolatopsis samaneae]|uniref:Uncharacterized protein n=1 Tax=Amycolatopsis samaneae TaxID=664691 RepID=A0ABW5GCI4_9PSEU
MAVVEVVGDELRVGFSRWERLAARRAGLVVPLAAVRAVECVGDPLARTRGGRVGFLVSGLVKVGVWGLGTGRRQLVSVRRAVPALRVTLDRAAHGGRFDELLISTDDAEGLAAAISGVRTAGV